MIELQDIARSLTDSSRIPTEYNIYPKANVLISAKYKSSLLENQIMAYSLAHASQFDLGNSERENIKSRILVSELRNVLGGNDGSFYTRLRDAAKSMTGRTVGLSSEDGTSFDYIAVVTRATCENGVFTLEYNAALRSALVNLKKNYSRLNLTIQMSFRSNYAFRLYELLKQKCFHARDDHWKNSNTFAVDISLAELKLDVGVVNAELASVRKVLQENGTPNYEKAVEASPEKMFERWSDFRNRVLVKALEEINEKSDIRVEFEPIKQGKGGKVRAIHFTITQISLEDTKIRLTLSEDEIFEFLFQVRGVTGGEFSLKDLRSIAEASEWNLGKIEEAYKLLKAQDNVENPTGWMIKAVREGYRPSPKPVEKQGRKKKQAKKNNFCDFDQRDYNYSDLERRLAAMD